MIRSSRTLAAAALAALVAACGGGGGGESAAPAPAPATPAAEGALRAAQPGDLVAYFRARIEQRSAQGLSGTEARDLVTATTGIPVPATAASTGALTGGNFTSTTVQEPGVDEDDLLKTDGSYVYAIHSPYWAGSSMTTGTLAVSRIQSDNTLASVGSVALDTAFSPLGMYVTPGSTQVTVVSQRGGYGVIQPLAAQTLLPYPTTQEIALDMYNVVGGAQARQHRISIDGRVVATRMIGSVLYVASAWNPDLSRYNVPPRTPATQVQTLLAPLAPGDLLPTIRVDGGAAQPLVSESDCLLQPANASLSLQLTTVTAIDLASVTLERRSRCFVGDASGLYMSPTAAYLASSRQVWIQTVNASSILPREETTDIHKFALQGLAVDYRGSGEVVGTLGWDVEKIPYRMSEFNGDLRVVSFTGQTPSTSPARITVLREDAAQRRLATLATLPNAQNPSPLGRTGEQVYGVNFAGAFGYVVTFRRTDPLYVIDLSNPAAPRAAGELTVPGFSDYLFPLANGKLLGVGRDANDAGIAGGVKVALFDVANPAQPRLLASSTLGDRSSTSALDYSRHGINLFANGAQVRVALPVRLASTTSTGTRYEQGLARFTVDTAAGTLTQRARVMAMTYTRDSDYGVLLQYDLARDRAVQTANASYYLTGGRIIASNEP